MGCDVSQYKDQHEPWRPDYPPVFNFPRALFCVDVEESSVRACSYYEENKSAFSFAREVIIKVIGFKGNLVG